MFKELVDRARAYVSEFAYHNLYRITFYPVGIHISDITSNYLEECIRENLVNKDEIIRIIRSPTGYRVDHYSSFYYNRTDVVFDIMIPYYTKETLAHALIEIEDRGILSDDPESVIRKMNLYRTDKINSLDSIASYFIKKHFRSYNLNDIRFFNTYTHELVLSNHYGVRELEVDNYPFTLRVNPVYMPKLVETLKTFDSIKLFGTKVHIMISSKLESNVDPNFINFTIAGMWLPDLFLSCVDTTVDSFVSVNYMLQNQDDYL